MSASEAKKGAGALEPSHPAGSVLDAGDYKAGDDAVERFRELLRIPTVSRDDKSLRDDEPFRRWAPTLRRLFPRFFEVTELTTIDDFGMLLRWPGADPSLDPVVMMAHQDVVPVEGQQWEHDPFGAEIVDGEIWARGTLDTKCIAAAFFEAAEHLVGQGYVPPRDVWFFSSDGEEVAAPTCAHAVEWFRAHGIHPYMVLDEGGAVAADAPLGVDVPVAMVGVSEKGHVDLTVTAYADGGHASTPSANDACRLLCRVCEHISANPGKPVLTPVVEATLAELGAHSSDLYRAVFGNLWLTRPAVTKIMAASPETAAMLRTTYALTQMEGSPAHNVLPPVARANFNVRVAPFESIADPSAPTRMTPPSTTSTAASPASTPRPASPRTCRTPAPTRTSSMPSASASTASAASSTRLRPADFCTPPTSASAWTCTSAASSSTSPSSPTSPGCSRTGGPTCKEGRPFFSAFER